MSLPVQVYEKLSWIESNSGLISAVSLVVALVSALFKPATWRRVVASIGVSLTGILFVPYDPAHLWAWFPKIVILAFAFTCSFWWLVGRIRNLTNRRKSLPVQVSGTFEAAVEAVGRVVAQSGDSDITTRISTDAGTFTLTKRPGKKKK